MQEARLAKDTPTGAPGQDRPAPPRKALAWAVAAGLALAGLVTGLSQVLGLLRNLGVIE